MIKKIRGVVLRSLISFGAIGLIYYFMRSKVDDALGILQHDVAWLWFAVAFFIYLAAILLQGIRLRQAFRCQDISLHYGESIYLSFIGLFFNLFLPSAVGGDVAKAYFAYQHNGKKVESLSAVFQDRLVGFVAIISMALIALFFARHEISDPRIHRLLYVVATVMIFSAVFFMSRRFASRFSFLKRFVPSKSLHAKLETLYNAINKFKTHKRTLLSILLLSFAAQSLFILLHYYVALSLKVEINLVLFFLIVPIVAIVSMVPSVGGLGVREAGLIFMMKPYMPTERALALSLLIFAIVYGVSFISGMIYALQGGLKPRLMHDMENLNQ